MRLLELVEFTTIVSIEEGLAEFGCSSKHSKSQKLKLTKQIERNKQGEIRRFFLI